MNYTGYQQFAQQMMLEQMLEILGIVTLIIGGLALLWLVVYVCCITWLSLSETKRSPRRRSAPRQAQERSDEESQHAAFICTISKSFPDWRWIEGKSR